MRAAESLLPAKPESDDGDELLASSGPKRRLELHKGGRLVVRVHGAVRRICPSRSVYVSIMHGREVAAQYSAARRERGASG